MSTPPLRVNGIDGPPAGTVTVGAYRAGSVQLGGWHTPVLVNGSQVATRTELAEQHAYLTGLLEAQNSIQLAYVGLVAFSSTLAALLIWTIVTTLAKRAQVNTWIARQPKRDDGPYRGGVE